MTLPLHRNRHSKYRKKYKIYNRRPYERSLVNHGDYTLWPSEDVIQSWMGDLNQRMGRAKLYSNLLLKPCLVR